MKVFATRIEGRYRFGSQLERLPIYVYVIAELIEGLCHVVGVQSR
jgi:hypothetical protein